MTNRLKEVCGFDVLGDVLETLRFRGSIFFRSELAAPWGVSLGQNEIPRFHIALSGGFFLGTDSDSSINVQEMDIIMLPTGSEHWLADQPGNELTPMDSAVEACQLNHPFFSRGEITNRIMCGLVQFDQNITHPLLNSLPQLLHFPALNSNEPIWKTVLYIEQEICRTQRLRNPIIDRLTEVLFLQLLDYYINKQNEATGFLAGLRDRRIQRALSLIHQQPEFTWSLSSLGEQIGMSRATLVRHFQDTVGIAPMAYITNWRMIKAHNLIKYSSATLEQIAEGVGFASARTLNKAFQRHYGCTPNELRRTQFA